MVLLDIIPWVALVLNIELARDISLNPIYTVSPCMREVLDEGMIVINSNEAAYIGTEDLSKQYREMTSTFGFLSDEVLAEGIVVITPNGKAYNIAGPQVERYRRMSDRNGIIADSTTEEAVNFWIELPYMPRIVASHLRERFNLSRVKLVEAHMESLDRMDIDPPPNLFPVDEQLERRLLRAMGGLNRGFLEAEGSHNWEKGEWEIRRGEEEDEEDEDDVEGDRL